MLKTMLAEGGRYLLETVALFLAFLVSLGGVNAVHAGQSGYPPVMMAAADQSPDILAQFDLAWCLALGSLLCSWAYFAAKVVKDQLFLKDYDRFKRVCFLSVSFVVGMFLGLFGAYKIAPEINRSWVFLCGGGGALAAWGLFDTIILALEKMGKSKLGGG
jgi:hypothetical protein